MASYGRNGQGGATTSGPASAGQVAYFSSATDVTGSVGLTFAVATGLGVIALDAGTATNTNALTLTHQSTGTPAANMAVGIALAVESTTVGTDHTIAEIQAVAATNTTGGVSSNILFRNRSSGAALATCLTLGFNGVITTSTNVTVGGSCNTSGGLSASAATAVCWVGTTGAAQNRLFTSTPIGFASSASVQHRNVRIDGGTCAITGSTPITTATGLNYVEIGAPAYTNASITIDAAATVYIAGPPTISGGGTITAAYPLWIDSGTPRIDSGAANAGVACVFTLTAGPTGAGTAIAEWLTINVGGTTRYLPCW